MSRRRCELLKAIEPECTGGVEAALAIGGRLAMINGISHANIRLEDIDGCLPFYRDVLGLKITLDEGEQQTSIAHVNSRRAVFLRWDSAPYRSFIVLQSFPSGFEEGQARSRDFRARLTAMGLNHFGFWVDDLDGILARAAMAGVQFVREAVVTCVGRHYGYAGMGEEACVRTAQLSDPEGNVIQLDQWVGPHGGSGR
jgi:catechol 2,3-dioxygenase-like lactoylglutathione lyase family enzyme